MRGQIASLMPTTTYYSECECGQVLEGEGDYDRGDGTLYGNDCDSCGAEFIVSGWFEQCDFCDEFHPEEEHKEERK